MYQDKTFLAIIPARSGSKRLPNKNIKELCGKPLIAWSIEAGLQSKYIDNIVVSTDSQEYANIAQKYGAEVPFLRPSNISLDTSSSFEVISHTINFYKEHFQKEFDYVVLLQPTSPLRDGKLIDKMCQWVVDNKIELGISVSKCEHPPLWSNTLPDDKRMDNFFHPDIINKRSQELPQYYRINGVLYIAKITSYFENKGFVSSQTYAFEIDQRYGIDIDTELDFEYAEFMMQKFKGKWCLKILFS